MKAGKVIFLFTIVFALIIFSSAFAVAVDTTKPVSFRNYI